MPHQGDVKAMSSGLALLESLARRRGIWRIPRHPPPGTAIGRRLVHATAHRDDVATSLLPASSTVAITTHCRGDMARYHQRVDSLRARGKSRHPHVCIRDLGSPDWAEIAPAYILSQAEAAIQTTGNQRRARVPVLDRNGLPRRRFRRVERGPRALPAAAGPAAARRLALATAARAPRLVAHFDGRGRRAHDSARQVLVLFRGG